VCDIVLFRYVIILFVVVWVVLIVDIYCTSVVYVVLICTGSGVDVWAPNIANFIEVRYIKY
jgi:hypothetical protein